MSSSCSFRITRTAEDIAQTINSLSQRLVKLEEKVEVLQLKLVKDPQEPSLEETEILDGVDQLLRDCRELLSSSDVEKNSTFLSEENTEEDCAA